MGRPRKKQEAGDLDEVDRRVLVALEMDPQASVRKLARAAGTSPASIVRRLSALKARGFTSPERSSVVVPRMIGLDIEAIVELRLSPGGGSRRATLKGRVDQIVAELKKIPAVRRLWFVAGDADFVAAVLVRDVDHLSDVIQEIEEVPGVGDTRTSVVLQRKIDVAKVPFEMLPDFAAAVSASKANSPRPRGRTGGGHVSGTAPSAKGKRTRERVPT